MVLDDLATSAEFGRINPLDKLLEPTIVCPAMVFGTVKVQRPTMTIQQCKERLSNKDRICISCKTIRQLLPNLPEIKPRKPKPRYSICACGWKYESRHGAVVCSVCTVIDEIAKAKTPRIRRHLLAVKKQLEYKRRISQKKKVDTKSDCVTI